MFFHQGRARCHHSAAPRVDIHDKSSVYLRLDVNEVVGNIGHEQFGYPVDLKTGNSLTSEPAGEQRVALENQLWS